MAKKKTKKKSKKTKVDQILSDDAEIVVEPLIGEANEYMKDLPVVKASDDEPLKSGGAWC